MCVHTHTQAHTHSPASPSSLTGSYFCKAAFCFVSCLAAFDHMRLSLMPSLPFLGRELFSHFQLLCFPSHSTVFTIMGSAPGPLCLLVSMDRLPVYTIARLFLLIHNHVPYAFLSNRDLFCSLFLTDTCKPVIDLSCQLFLLSPCTGTDSGSVYFLQFSPSPCINVQANPPVKPLLSAKRDFQCGQKQK